MRSLCAALAGLILLAPVGVAAEEHQAPPATELKGPADPVPPRAEPPGAPASDTAGAPAAPAAAPPTAAPSPDHATPTGEAAAGHAVTAPPTSRPPAAATRPAVKHQAPGEPAAHEPGPAAEAASAASAIRALGKPKDAAGREPGHETPIPPSLTGKALADELRRSAGGRASDKEAQAAERVRLEKLAKEIAEARAALKIETARLQELLTQAAKPVETKATPKPGAKPQPTTLDSLSRTVKGMKSEQAAAMLAHLDRPLAAALLERMKPAEASAVLEKMDTAAGAALVALLAKKGAP